MMEVMVNLLPLQLLLINPRQHAGFVVKLDMWLDPATRRKGLSNLSTHVQTPWTSNLIASHGKWTPVLLNTSPTTCQLLLAVLLVVLLWYSHSLMVVKLMDESVEMSKSMTS